MFSQLEFLIAFRYLRSKRSEGFISIIAGFSLVGIILGVATLIIVMSVMNGFRAELIGRILGLNGHIGIYQNQNNFLNYDEFSVGVAEIPGVKAVTPQIEGQGLIVYNNNSSGIIVRGVRWSDLSARKQLWNSIGNKEIESFNNNGIIIGHRLAKKLNIQNNDDVFILTPQLRVTAFGSVPKQKKFKVIQTFDVGMFEYDSSFVFMSLDDAQSLYGYDKNNTISNLEVYLNSTDDIALIKNKLLEISDKNLIITDWIERNYSFINALKVERNVMFIILSLIILIAAFNIISGLTILVKNKTRDIAILKSIGVQNNSITKIFFLVGFFIGTLSTFFGIIIGIVFSINIESIRALISNLFNISLFPEEIYFLSKMPSEINPLSIFIIGMLSIIITCLVSIYPAIKASKIDTIKSLKYE